MTRLLWFAVAVAITSQARAVTPSAQHAPTALRGRTKLAPVEEAPSEVDPDAQAESLAAAQLIEVAPVPLADLIRKHGISLVRFDDESIFGPGNRKYRDPPSRHDYPVVRNLVDTEPLALQTITEISMTHGWIKVSGKNGVKVGDTLDRLNKLVPALHEMINEQYPKAGILFDGDNNELSCPFSQLIKMFVQDGRFVLAVKSKDKPGNVDEVSVVSDGFVDGWKRAVMEMEMGSDNNFWLLFLNADPAAKKDIITKAYASASIYVGSGMEQFRYRKGKMGEDTDVFTGGYNEMHELEMQGKEMNDLCGDGGGAAVIIYNKEHEGDKPKLQREACSQTG